MEQTSERLQLTLWAKEPCFSSRERTIGAAAGHAVTARDKHPSVGQ